MEKYSGKRIVMVGAGNLATQLSGALLHTGNQIIQVYSRTAAHARALAGTLNSSWTDRISEITDQGDLYILAVSDSALLQLASQIKIDSQLIVHTSGSMGMDIFTGKVKNYGVFYPLQTFSINRPVDFKEIPVAIEGNNKESEAALMQLGRQVSGRVIKLNSTDRLYLHLAAVFACNFTNHLYHLASLILERKNIPFDLLLPLIQETAGKVRTILPGEGQTGPAVRNDQIVIKKHLDLLSFSPEIRELYDSISRSIFSLSHNS
jgi:predicted short-subunit dehydrogenase-like oxidoreductase (DUF2520 family)